MRASAVLAVFTAALCGVGWSCALESFSKGDPQPLASGGSGGTGGSGGGTGGVGAACQSDAYPAPPSIGDTNTRIEFYSAIRSVNFEDAGANLPVGIDLDRRCTCDPTGYDEGPSCLPPDGLDVVCDLGNGRDNAFYQIVQLASVAFQLDFEAAFSESANNGSATLLFRVQDYNGLPDDPDVKLSLFSASGRTDPPTWDGTDTWPISETSLVEGGTTVDEPRYVDEAAYVVGGKLVSGLNASVITFAGSNGRIELELLGAGLIADIVDGPLGYELRNGVFTGLITEEGLFRTVASYRDAMGAGFCSADQSFQFGARFFCDARDATIVQSPGPTTQCDALTFAMGFNAEATQGPNGTIVAEPIDMGGCMETPPTSCEAYFNGNAGGAGGGS